MFLLDPPEDFLSSRQAGISFLSWLPDTTASPAGAWYCEARATWSLQDRLPATAPEPCVHVARSMGFGQRLAGTTCRNALDQPARRSGLFRSAVLKLPPCRGGLSRAA